MFWLNKLFVFCLFLLSIILHFNMRHPVLQTFYMKTYLSVSFGIWGAFGSVLEGFNGFNGGGPEFTCTTVALYVELLDVIVVGNIIDPEGKLIVPKFFGSTIFWCFCNWFIVGNVLAKLTVCTTFGWISKSFTVCKGKNVKGKFF